MDQEINPEDRLRNLMQEDDDLDFSGELEDLIKDVRWLAIFRVHTTKPFSHAALFNAMHIAWSAAKELRKWPSRC